MVSQTFCESKLSPPAQFFVQVLACLSDSRDSSSLEYFLRETRAFDWHEFLRLVSLHGIGAHVWFALKKMQLEELIPEEVQRALRERYIMNLAIDKVQSQELSALLQAFAQESISVLVLKGLPLHQRLFPEREWPRGAGDIDFLLHREDMDRAMRALEHLGFQFSPEEGRTLEWYRRLSHQLQFEKKGALSFPVTVELHWSATPDLFGRKVSFENILKVWEEVKDLEWENTSVSVLSDENLLFYQAFHLFSDWAKLAFPTLLDFHHVATLVWPLVSKERLLEKGASFGLGQLLGAASQLVRLFYDSPALAEIGRTFPLPEQLRSLLARMMNFERIISTGKLDVRWVFFSSYPLDIIFGLTPPNFFRYWWYRFRHSRWFER